MPNYSQILDHPQRVAIDAALDRGISQRRVATMFGLSKDAVRRYDERRSRRSAPVAPAARPHGSGPPFAGAVYEFSGDELDLMDAIDEAYYAAASAASGVAVPDLRRCYENAVGPDHDAACPACAALGSSEPLHQAIWDAHYAATPPATGGRWIRP